MRKTNPLISVIINCHNGEKYLKKCIKSVISQDYKNWEIIFWDNCSKDRSVKILEKFNNKKIRKYKSKKFYKLYKARNLALQKAKGEFIAFLDVDDYWKRDKLQRQINLLMKSKKEYKMVYSNYFVKDQNKKQFKIKYSKKLPQGSITQDLLKSYDVGILSVLAKKEVFKKKKFNINYDIIGDFDFFVNFSLKNKIAVIQKPLAIYRVHGENLSSKKIQQYKNELKYWLKTSKSLKKFENYSFASIKYLLFKLEIKNLIKNFLKIMGV